MDTLESNITDPRESNEKFAKYTRRIGMLMYLANNTRSDIAYSVHACARYTHSPKQSHGTAVKQILRYLQGTKDKGIYLKPDGDKMLEIGRAHV